MNKISKLALSVAVSLPLLGVGVVFAEDTPTANTTTSQAAQTTQSSDGQTKSEETKKAELKSQFEKRKTALKAKLTTAQQKRIKERCKNAQTLISKLDARDAKTQQGRLAAYDGVVTKLTNLETKVAAQGVDTTSLKAQITALQAKVANFKTDMEAYRFAVSDTASMSCTTDPAAFKASLAASREDFAKIKADAADIRMYLKDTIKPTLAAIRTELKKGEAN